MSPEVELTHSLSCYRSMFSDENDLNQLVKLVLSLKDRVPENNKIYLYPQADQPRLELIHLSVNVIYFHTFKIICKTSNKKVYEGVIWNLVKNKIERVAISTAVFSATQNSLAKKIIGNNERIIELIKHRPHFIHTYDFITYQNPLGFTLVQPRMETDLYNMSPVARMKIPLKIRELMCLRLIKQLELLHRYGIAHRDIKPENIVLKIPDCEPYLIDYDFNTHESDTYPLMCASVTYSPPETLEFINETGKLPYLDYFKEGDIWALGCVFTELIDPLSIFDWCPALPETAPIYNFLSDRLNGKTLLTFDLARKYNVEYKSCISFSTFMQKFSKIPNLKESIYGRTIRRMILPIPESRIDAKEALVMMRAIEDKATSLPASILNLNIPFSNLKIDELDLIEALEFIKQKRNVTYGTRFAKKLTGLKCGIIAIGGGKFVINLPERNSKIKGGFKTVKRALLHDLFKSNSTLVMNACSHITCKEHDIKNFERKRFVLEKLKWEPYYFPKVYHIISIPQDYRHSIIQEIYDGNVDSLIRVYRKNLSRTKLLKISLDIASGLEIMHRHGIAHGDFHLENILYKTLYDCFDIRITDFGLSYTERTFEEYTRDFNCSNYATAPECWLKVVNDYPLNPAEFLKPDIWTFGKCLIDIFNFKRYPTDFVSQKLFNLKEKILDETPLDIEEKQFIKFTFSEKNNSKSNDQLENLIKQMIDPMPEKRPNISSVKIELEKALHDSQF